VTASSSAKSASVALAAIAMSSQNTPQFVIACHEFSFSLVIAYRGRKHDGRKRGFPHRGSVASVMRALVAADDGATRRGRTANKKRTGGKSPFLRQT
jgi:hypothetical protein